MSASKSKGTRGERLVVNHLIEAGFYTAERRALEGTADRGDVAGVPGWTLEVKNASKHTLATWMDELDREQIRAQTPLGALVVLRRMRPIGRAYAIMEFDQLIAIMKEVP